MCVPECYVINLTRGECVDCDIMGNFEDLDEVCDWDKSDQQVCWDDQGTFCCVVNAELKPGIDPDEAEADLFNYHKYYDIRGPIEHVNLGKIRELRSKWYLKDPIKYNEKMNKLEEEMKDADFNKAIKATRLYLCMLYSGQLVGIDKFKERTVLASENTERLKSFFPRYNDNLQSCKHLISRIEWDIENK